MVNLLCCGEEVVIPGEQTVKMKNAGVALFSGTKILLLHRRDGKGWALPAGSVEDGETAQEAAFRELSEETQIKGVTQGARLYTTTDGFVCYRGEVEGEPAPTLDEEHDGYVWTTLPEMSGFELHPGMAALAVTLMGTETDVAKAIRDGVLASPVHCRNMWLFDIRITGTGVAYRAARQEFAYRDPAVYLNDTFLERCAGLPVLWEHPETVALTSEEYAKRTIGSVMLAYIKDQDVWGVARIYDESAAAEMMARQLSTSPGVAVLPSAQGMIDDGTPIKIEYEPLLLDHVAICERGVWDKAGDPTGVASEGALMTEVTEDARADSAPAPIPDYAKAILDGLANLNARMDSVEAATKVSAAPVPAAVADADEDPGKDEPVKDPYADSVEELKNKIADMETKMSGYSDAEAEELADAQAECDSVTAALGVKKIRPISGERPLQFTRRAINELKTHTQAWKDIDVSSVADSATLRTIANQVFAEARKVAETVRSIPAGQLIARELPGRAHRTVVFEGDIQAAFRPFISPARAVRNGAFAPHAGA